MRSIKARIAKLEKSESKANWQEEIIKNCVFSVIGEGGVILKRIRIDGTQIPLEDEQSKEKTRKRKTD